MRISDWSSDVCSSDLSLVGRQAGQHRLVELRGRQPQVARLCQIPGTLQQEIGRASCRERVWSVRVDLGGRRLIKKKKNNKMSDKHLLVDTNLCRRIYRWTEHKREHRKVETCSK